MQKITPFLWFNDNVEEVIQFYTSIFPDSRLVSQVNNTPGTPGPEGSVMTAVLQLQGQTFILLNGGPQFRFNEAVSFVISCESQQEVDAYWNQLSEGGEQMQCGWLKDRFGLFWQVVPASLPKLLGSGDVKQTRRVMEVLMTMKKLDIDLLEAAARGV